MPKFKLFNNRGKAAAIRSSYINRKQEKAKRLMMQLESLRNVKLNPLQIAEIRRLQGEGMAKMAEIMGREREISEEYMQKEIDVILNIGNKYKAEELTNK